MKKYAFYAVFLGLLVLLISWSAQGCIELIQSGFAQSMFLGWCVVLGFTSVVTGILYLLSIECRGYVAVRRVDALAASLQDNDLRLSRKYTVKWLATLSQTERIAMVEQATSVHEIRTILLPIVDMIDTKIDAVIAKESLLTGAVVGISPWPMIDGAVVAWRQLRLMRSIATAYGVRPGTIGTIGLLKKVVFSVAFADASEHVMQWISAKIPSMGGLIPSAGQAVATAVLTARLGKSCKSACRPLKIGKGKSPSTFSKMKRFCKQSLLQYPKHECTPPTSGRATTRSADS
tara:strand:+ start:2700 stop:3569 length:870 start_codon:yes stop_codon:yes gene_type:complete